MIRPCIFAVSTLALALAVGACEPSRRGEPEAESSELTEGPDEHERQALAAMGYLDYAAEPAGRPAVDFDRASFHPERSAPGYTLVVSLPLGRADMVSHHGEIVRSWVSPEKAKWARAELATDGRLAVVASEPTPGSEPSRSFLEVYDFAGRRLWRRELPVHHDIEWVDRGELLILTKGDGQRPPPRRGWFIDNGIARISAQGDVMVERSLAGLLSSAPELFEFTYTTRYEEPELARADVLHTNSLELIRRPHPIFRPGDVLVSLRHQDLLAVVDLDGERLIWAYGPGELIRQHEATVLPNGNVLAFDNGGPERPWSRIVEIDPVARAVVWQYRGDPPSSFYSAGRGTAQGLAGGNVLVANSNAGEVFEVTRDGEVVWRYLSRLNQEGHRSVVRAFRYPTELVDGLLVR